jgi:hypothetical protein
VGGAGDEGSGDGVSLLQPLRDFFIGTDDPLTCFLSPRRGFIAFMILVCSDGQTVNPVVSGLSFTECLHLASTILLIFSAGDFHKDFAPDGAGRTRHSAESRDPDPHRIFMQRCPLVILPTAKENPLIHNVSMP